VPRRLAVGRTSEGHHGRQTERQCPENPPVPWLPRHGHSPPVKHRPGIIPFNAVSVCSRLHPFEASADDVSHPQSCGIGCCRKCQFWRQNPTIENQQFNDLHTPKCSKKQICDGIIRRLEVHDPPGVVYLQPADNAVVYDTGVVYLYLADTSPAWTTGGIPAFHHHGRGTPRDTTCRSTPSCCLGWSGPARS